MQKTKRVMQKTLIIQMIFIIVLAMILNMTAMTSSVKAVSQYTRTGVEAFPESYKEDLRKLQSTYKNWTFTAYYTGINWQDFINGECSPINKNTIPDSNPLYVAPGGYQTDPGFWCASRGAIEYYADPRNFLSDTGIFQFMEMSYNRNIHNKQGVENILKGSFMDRSVSTSTETHDTTVVAKVENGCIIITPGVTNVEVAVAVGMTNFEVKNKEQKSMSIHDLSATGYTFRDKTYNKEYKMVVLGDVNGDGKVKATDYARIQSHIEKAITLSEIEQLAADVNRDGKVKATDYARIQSYITDKYPITITSTQTTTTSTMRYSDIIIKAAEESGISPYSIAIKIIQEVGRNGSGSTSGTYAGYEGYYNFFNWGASDKGSDGKSAVEKGLIYAKEKGWNSQYKSIVEGAKLMANNYVSIGQNTSYFYKFNVIDNGVHSLYTHQYMTNIKDPSSQAKNLFTTYAENNVLDSSLNFVIPVFNNMPSNKCTLPTTIDKTDPNARYIDAYDVALRDGARKSAKILKYLSYEYVALVETRVITWDNTNWVHVRTSDGTEGWMTNEFFK